MRKRTGANQLGRPFAAGILAVFAVGGCGGGPTAPSPTAQETAVPTVVAVTPSILSVTPSIGSNGGGAHLKVTGTGLGLGTRVALGTTSVPAYFDNYSGAILVTAPSHAPGTVDVSVTNADGQTAVASGAYTFAVPDSFQVNGDWRGVSYAGEDDVPFTFRVENGAVISVTCSTGSVELSPPAPIIKGGFSFEGDGVAPSGRILAPNEAMGVVTFGATDANIRPCVRAEWHVTKQ
jgi:hypothetical protein